MRHKPVSSRSVSGRLTVGGLLEVDVGVSERAAGHHVPAHPDGEDGTRGAELLVQHGLRDVRVQISHIQGRHGVTGSTGVHLQLLYTRTDQPETHGVGRTRTDQLETHRTTA